MSELVPVRVRDCACPDTPHADEGDLVYLLPRPPLRMGVLALQAAGSGGTVASVTADWFEIYIRHGAVGANFIEPFDPQVLLDDFALGSPVAEAANDLYGEVLLSPLAGSPSSSSSGGQTAGSTSRSKRSPTTSRG